MYITNKQLERLISVIDRNLLSINSTLDYERLTDCFILLGNMVNNLAEDNDDWFYLGESTYSGGIDALIVGAYWHFTEWHGGQQSKSYAALCALGQVFSPGMSTIEDEEGGGLDVYTTLNELAEEKSKE